MPCTSAEIHFKWWFREKNIFFFPILYIFFFFSVLFGKTLFYSVFYTKRNSQRMILLCDLIIKIKFCSKFLSNTFLYKFYSRIQKYNKRKGLFISLKCEFCPQGMIGYAKLVMYIFYQHLIFYAPSFWRYMMPLLLIIFKKVLNRWSLLGIMRHAKPYNNLRVIY